MFQRGKPNIVGVQFKPSGRVNYFDSAGVRLEIGDRVLVEYENGLREGCVVIAPEQVLYSDLRGSLERIERKVEEDESDSS